jgi:hypothetical protein
MPEENDFLKSGKNAANDYEQTVKAILAFSAFVVHDGKNIRPYSQFGLGRRMLTSSSNKIRPSSDVTPDLVAQKSENYGIVAEVKKSLPKDKQRWVKYIEQLRKYDDSLKGWWTPNEMIEHSNAVMLVHYGRSRDFKDFLKREKEKDNNAVGGNTCVVEFSESPETVINYAFRTEYGEFIDPELGNRLYSSIQIPLDDVLKTFPSIQYYDQPPPLPLLLTRLWMDVFQSMIENGVYNEEAKITRISASVEEITKIMQRAYGSGALYSDARSVEFPKKKWIQRAFDVLVKYNLANAPTDGGDTYEILYKGFRDDVLEHFIKIIGTTDAEDADIDSSQTSLFGESEDET